MTLILGFGEVQFITKEFLIEQNSAEVNITIEKIHDIKHHVGVNWKIKNTNKLNGSIFFDDTDDRKVIKLNIKNIAANKSIQIELLEPTNGYQLGENKVANISIVCK